MSPTAMPHVAGVRHRDVDLGEVRLHVAEAGSGPPLLPLHGWPQHWWSWRRLIPALAERYRVIAPDLRGWGWSSAPPGDYAKATWARDVLALLDAEGLREPARAAASSACYRTFLTRELPAAISRGDRSGELRVPSLLVMGGRSALRLVLDPQPGPNLQVVTVAGAGHVLPEEAPDAVLAHALPFLGGA